MKRLLLLLFLINFPFVLVKGQSMLTHGQVFDFNINDEFHTKVYNNAPPNATRIKIIGKHFSTNNDTVFYLRHFDNYSSIPDYTTSPPHLVYSYSIGNDSVFYTNLDSGINLTYGNFLIDSCNSFHDTLYYTSQFCGSQVSELTECRACCFEGYYTNDIYGKGLGLVYHHYAHAAEWVDDVSEMFYYKKDTVVCGTPDTATALTVIELGKTKQNIVLYPNPASYTLTLRNINRPTSIGLYDILGKLVMETKTDRNTTLDISQLTQGVYTLISHDDQSVECYKVIINKE